MGFSSAMMPEAQASSDWETWGESLPCFRAETILHLCLILLESINNKKEKAFLLVEIRMLYREIPSIASMYICATF
jgi:hypothetical protein